MLGLGRTLVNGVNNRKVSVTAVGTAAARYVTAGLIAGDLLLLLLLF